MRVTYRIYEKLNLTSVPCRVCGKRIGNHYVADMMKGKPIDACFLKSAEDEHFAEYGTEDIQLRMYDLS